MSVTRRLWQIAQALVLLASLAVFLLIASGYALLVFFAHDAKISHLDLPVEGVGAVVRLAEVLAC